MWDPSAKACCTSFAASGPQQPKIQCSTDTDEIAVEGYVVDAVESISASSNTKEELAVYLVEMEDMVNSAVLRTLRDTPYGLK